MRWPSERAEYPAAVLCSDHINATPREARRHVEGARSDRAGDGCRAGITKRENFMGQKIDGLAGVVACDGETDGLVRRIVEADTLLAYDGRSDALLNVATSRLFDDRAR